jgi:hypothetical protein
MSNYIRATEEDFGENTEVTSAIKIDMSLNRSLGELCDSFWEFTDSVEPKTKEEENEFGALVECLEGMGFVTHLL